MGAGAGAVVQTNIEQLYQQWRYQGRVLGTMASRASSKQHQQQQQQLPEGIIIAACYMLLWLAICAPNLPLPHGFRTFFPSSLINSMGPPHSPRPYWYWVLVCSRGGRAHNVVQGARLPSCFGSSSLSVLLPWLPWLWCEHLQLHPRCSLCISRRFLSSTTLQIVNRPRLSSHHSIWPIMALVYRERIVWKSTAWAPLNGSRKEELWNAVLFDARDGGARWASRFIPGPSCEEYYGTGTSHFKLSVHRVPGASHLHDIWAIGERITVGLGTDPHGIYSIMEISIRFRTGNGDLLELSSKLRRSSKLETPSPLICKFCTLTRDGASFEQYLTQEPGNSPQIMLTRPDLPNEHGTSSGDADESSKDDGQEAQNAPSNSHPYHGE